MGMAVREVRPYQGGTVSSAVGFQAIGVGLHYDFVDISGVGALRFVAMMVNSGTDSHKALPEIIIDGVTIEPSESLQALAARGYNEYTLPIKLTLYAVDGSCHILFVYEPLLLFDASLKIRALNGSATDSISVLASWVYYSR